MFARYEVNPSPCTDPAVELVSQQGSFYMENMMNKIGEIEKKVEHKLDEQIRKHMHPSAIHGNKTFGQKAADFVAIFTGSWKFIIGYIFITFGWVTWNTVGALIHFDPYPFIFYTFSVSVLAILMSAVIMLSQNRQAEIDRSHAENAYHQIDEVYNNLMSAIKSLTDIDSKQDKQLDILEGQNETMIKQHQELIDNERTQRSEGNVRGSNE